MAQKVWVIGGSNGIGLELVKEYLRNDNEMIVSSRNATTSHELSRLLLVHSSKLKLLDIDVTDEANVKTVTKRVWDFMNGIDVCIYNAGVYESMKVATWNLEHFEMMNQVNYLGFLRVVTSLTPLFQSQGSY